MNVTARAALAFLPALLVVGLAHSEAEINLTPGPAATQAITDAVIAADAALFTAVFDTCDVEVLKGLVTDDMEFFHDKGGLTSTTGAAFVDSIRAKCERQRNGEDFLSRRELVADSVRVYPLNNYGAIEVGEHRFHAVREGRPDLLTETARFTMVWREDNGSWKLARVLSYDHVLAPQDTKSTPD